MEHRCARRINTELPVRLHSPGNPVMSGTMRNLSVTGGFVALGTLYPKPRGIVDVELASHYSRPVRRRWRAIVVRADTDGVALFFDETAMGYLMPLLAALENAEGMAPVPHRAATARPDAA